MNTHYRAVVSAPPDRGSGMSAFAIGVCCNDDEITELVYLDPRPEMKPTSLLAEETVRQLRAYLADAHYEFGLPLAPAGTAFQRKVWAQIAAIPCGATRSYGEVAETIHSGPRAVGNACGANPYPLVIPCHRVLAANQGLGGFARHRGGFLLDVKRWLLQHEGR
jgi:methylated-DNA-[protein]-cysteine S-methyltransferase